MALDKSMHQADSALARTAHAPRKKPYAAPRLTKYGHISKLTGGTSGRKRDGGRSRRRCL